MRRGAGILCADHRQRLPARAQVMHARSDCKRKIRIAVIGSHPSTVHPNARRWFWGGFKFGVIFNEVHHRLPWWRLEQRMRSLDRFHVKLDRGRPTTRSCVDRRGRVLRKDEGSKEKHYGKGFHVPSVRRLNRQGVVNESFIR